MSSELVGLLAPMEIELQPLVTQIGLVADGDRYVGRVDDVPVIARLTKIGMAAGAAAAKRIIADGATHVIVVGIAGGVMRGVATRTVLWPATVVHRAAGTTHRAAAVPGLVAEGTISCGDDLITDPAVLSSMAAQGIVAVDMETAAIAAVCEAAGIPWNAARGISDQADEGLVNAEIFALTGPDGRADQEALQQYLADRPDRLAALQQLMQDTNAATTGAAALAIEAVRSLSR